MRAAATLTGIPTLFGGMEGGGGGEREEEKRFGQDGGQFDTRFKLHFFFKPAGKEKKRPTRGSANGRNLLLILSPRGWGEKEKEGEGLGEINTAASAFNRHRPAATRQPAVERKKKEESSKAARKQ